MDLERLTDYENSVSKVTATGAGARDYTDGGKFGGKTQVWLNTIEKSAVIINDEPVKVDATGIGAPTKQ